MSGSPTKYTRLTSKNYTSEQSSTGDQLLNVATLWSSGTHLSFKPLCFPGALSPNQTQESNVPRLQSNLTANLFPRGCIPNSGRRRAKRTRSRHQKFKQPFVVTGHPNGRIESSSMTTMRTTKRKSDQYKGQGDMAYSVPRQLVGTHRLVEVNARIRRRRELLVGYTLIRRS